MEHRIISAMGGRATSEAKSAANRTKIRLYWASVRKGEIPPPRRRKVTEAIRRLAQRYFWWEKPEDALRYPLRFVARVMDLGTAADCETTEHEFGRKKMLAALQQAEPGWFRERSWFYWHYRLGLTPWGNDPPPLPFRTYGA